MRLETLTLKNFRCFGNEPVAINLCEDIIGLVGMNGAGKTTVLEALKRMFSPTASERLINTKDVHFGRGECAEDISEREVYIDVIFTFSGNDDEARLFHDMYYDGADGNLKARIRLEALYTADNALNDEIDIRRYAIITSEEVAFGNDDERKLPLSGLPTRFAELVYVPAHRDSGAVTKVALKRVLSKLERSAAWDEATKSQSEETAETLETNLNQVPAIVTVTELLQGYWEDLHDGHYLSKPKFGVVAREFSKLIRDLTIRFQKTPGGGQRSLDELSEGQTSLLYFALSATFHVLIWKMQAASPAALEGFKPLETLPPPITIFALEEPENHLSPFFLPRLLGLLHDLISEGSAQAIVTSHSPSIMSRIPPKNVRYLRLAPETLTSTAKSLPMPEGDIEAAKFVAQTIQSNPEVYFARLAIIGEGDSERLVIPKMADAFNCPLDPSFIAYLSIEGRHAQHFWKLLTELGIPHLTLLDFDMGRYQAGMGRIKNACTWLKDIGVPDINPETVQKNEAMTEEMFQKWMVWLNAKGIYYSYPLDLDMMMIQSYPDSYELKMYELDDDVSIEKIEKIHKKVFGNNGDGNETVSILFDKFTDNELYAYKCLFSSRSKPASHIKGLANIFDIPAPETEPNYDSITSIEDIKNKCPAPIAALIEKASLLISSPPDDGQD